MAGATVIADGPIVREATSSAAGVVTLDALPLGTYALRVLRAGFRPYARRVVLGSPGGGIAMVAVTVVPTNFTDLGAAADVRDALARDDGADVLAAHALARDIDANVVPVRSLGAATVAVGGASASESRIELDGIPLARGAGSLAAVRARDAIGLAAVDVVRGPALATTSLRDAIGGIVAYRTPETSGARDASGEAGYDSALGSFEAARTNVVAGNVRVLADFANGRALRSQTFKAAVDLSRGISVDVAQYGAQARLVDGATETLANAPAFAANLRATLGRSTFSARAFESTSNLDPSAGPSSSSRIRGVQLSTAMPLGEHLVTVGFDRRVERDRGDYGTVPNQTFTTLSARADLHLSSVARLEISDAYAGGTTVAPRHDPAVAFAVRTDSRTTLRISAGSAYATAPEPLLARTSPSSRAELRPETSFGARVQLDEALPDGGRTWISLDDLRRYDRFAARSEARSTGFEVGYERPPLPDRIDGTFAVRFERVRAFAAASPARDAFASDGFARSADDGTPSYKARVAIGYSDVRASANVGITAVGANNAFASHPIALGDAHVRLRVAGVADVRLGLENLFGFVVADPQLAPLFPPHELTLTIGSARDR